jgi:hypothetical protein
MENKLIVGGSTITLVVLVLASLSPVVSYTTSQSSTIDSPLFHVRTLRATEQDNSELNREYIGKGNTFLFPTKDNNFKQMQRVITSIQGMDDDTFEDFIASLIELVQKENRFPDVNPDDIREVLYEVRNNDKPLPIFDTHTENNKPIPDPLVTQRCPTGLLCYHTTGYGLEGFLGCILLLPVYLLTLIILIILKFILWCFPIVATMPIPHCNTLNCPKTLYKLF